jgi:hypothetical protein
MIKTEDLKDYGKVVMCEEVNDAFEVKITDGFNSNAFETFKVMKLINDSVGHIYSVVDKCITDDNLFDYRLIKKK